MHLAQFVCYVMKEKIIFSKMILATYVIWKVALTVQITRHASLATKPKIIILKMISANYATSRDA